MLGIIKCIPVRFIRPRFRDPRIRTFLDPVTTPPPGLALKAPEDWTVEKFFKKIGGDLEEYADKFDNVQQILDAKRYEFKGKAIPPRKRKHIMWVVEYLRRGGLSFEQLEKRTAASKPPIEKKAKGQAKGGKAKK